MVLVAKQLYPPASGKIDAVHCRAFSIPYFPANKPIFWTYFYDLIFWGRLIGRI